MIESEDDDVNNIVLNLWWPQDIIHDRVPTALGTFCSISGSSSSLNWYCYSHSHCCWGSSHSTTDTAHWCTNQEPGSSCIRCIVCEKPQESMTTSLLLWRHQVHLEQGNMMYVILKNFNDNFKLVKVANKDQYVRMMKVQKDTVLL